MMLALPDGKAIGRAGNRVCGLQPAMAYRGCSNTPYFFTSLLFSFMKIW
jgi:hypothetical protein